MRRKGGVLSQGPDSELTYSLGHQSCCQREGRAVGFIFVSCLDIVYVYSPKCASGVYTVSLSTLTLRRAMKNNNVGLVDRVGQLVDGQRGILIPDEEERRAHLFPFLNMAPSTPDTSCCRQRQRRGAPQCDSQARVCVPRYTRASPPLALRVRTCARDRLWPGGDPSTPVVPGATLADVGPCRQTLILVVCRPTSPFSDPSRMEPR